MIERHKLSKTQAEVYAQMSGFPNTGEVELHIVDDETYEQRMGALYGFGHIRHVTDGIPSWDWKPYKPGDPLATWSHIHTVADEMYYQCLFSNGVFKPLLDDRRSEIPPHEVTCVLAIPDDVDQLGPRRYHE